MFENGVLRKSSLGADINIGCGSWMKQTDMSLKKAAVLTLQQVVHTAATERRTANL